MILIHNAHIVNEERVFHGSVLIEGDSIADVFEGCVPQSLLDGAEVIEADDAILMPGVIDTHVHFRDPGFPEKADFSTESEAAVAGGVTSDHISGAVGGENADGRGQVLLQLRLLYRCHQYKLRRA